MAGFGGVYLEIIPQGGEAVREGDRPLLVEYSGSARTEMEKLVTTLNHVAAELSGLQEQVKPMLAANSSLRSGLGNIVEYLEKVTKQLPEVLQSAKDSADAIKLLANSAKPEEGMMKKIDAMVASINNFAHKLEVMKVEALQNQLLSLGKSLEATSKAVMTMSGSIEKTSQSAQESFLLRGGTRRVEEKQQADERAKTSAETAKTKVKAPGAPPAMSDATAKRGFFQKWFGSD
jgi:chromosome segregation ATPase